MPARGLARKAHTAMAASVSRETGDFGEAWRADDFTEIGLGDGWTVNAKVESEIRIGTTYDDRSGFRLGVFRRLFAGRSRFFRGPGIGVGWASDGWAECEGEGYECGRPSGRHSISGARKAS
jgi:hypothetical protein